MRFGLTHIVATNVCIWALETVVETARDYEVTQGGANLSRAPEVIAANVTTTTTAAPGKFKLRSMRLVCKICRRRM